MRPTLHKEKGTTLVEILVTLAITMAIMGAASKTFLVQRKTYDVQGQITQMVQTVRATVDFMTREMRMAGYNPTGAQFEGVAYDPDQLTFSADLNADGDTNDAEESITYTYDPANLQLKRDTGSGNQILADNIQGFSFDYLESGGGKTSIADDIRRVQIIISAQTEKPDSNYSSNNGYRSYTLASVVTPKNLGY